jgi:hypothetical protein
MEIKTLEVNESSSGLLIFDSIKSNTLIIKRGRYIEKKNNLSHPLFDEQNKYYKRIYALEYKGKKIYHFNIFGTNNDNHGYHVGFNFVQHQKFLWLQGKHWLQKEENIRYVVNIIFLILGLIIGLKKSGVTAK